MSQTKRLQPDQCTSRAGFFHTLTERQSGRGRGRGVNEVPQSGRHLDTVILAHMGLPILYTYLEHGAHN